MGHRIARRDAPTHKTASSHQMGHYHRRLVSIGGPRAKGRAVRVSVTFDEHLLADIDRDAKVAGLSRSAYLALTAKEHLLIPRVINNDPFDRSIFAAG